jgi:uncharacterized membrane protein YhdT
MQTNKTNSYAAIAAFSIAWVVLAYLSKYTTGTVSGISFYLPIVLIFTVPLLFSRDRATVIGILGGVLGVNYLISGGFQGALVALVFTVGIMMFGMYYLAPKAMAEMKRPVDWFTNIILTVVLLAIGETLANAVGSSPNLGSAWTAASATVLGGVILAVVNCIILRTLTPALRSSGLSQPEPQHPTVATPISNQSSA